MPRNIQVPGLGIFHKVGPGGSLLVASYNYTYRTGCFPSYPFDFRPFIGGYIRIARRGPPCRIICQDNWKVHCSFCWQIIIHAVDGRNPTPPEIYKAFVNKNCPPQLVSRISSLNSISPTLVNIFVGLPNGPKWLHRVFT